MATVFGWRKKSPLNLPRKRPAAFDESLEIEDSKEETENLSFAPEKRSCYELSKCLREEGAVFAENGRFSEAVKKWNEALSLTPNDEKLHEMKSQIFLQLDKTFEAVKSAENAVKLKPTWATAHQALGRAQIKLGEFDLAVKSFSKAVHLQPDDSELWNEDLLWSVGIRQKAYEHDKELQL